MSQTKNTQNQMIVINQFTSEENDVVCEALFTHTFWKEKTTTKPCILLSNLCILFLKTLKFLVPHVCISCNFGSYSNFSPKKDDCLCINLWFLTLIKVTFSNQNLVNKLLLLGQKFVSRSKLQQIYKFDDLNV